MENIFPVTGHLRVEFTGHRWIPRTWPVTQSFDVFFDLCLNKPLNKQSWGWWFETPSRPLWRHWNDLRQDWRLPSPELLAWQHWEWSGRHWHWPRSIRQTLFHCKHNKNHVLTYNIWYNNHVITVTSPCRLGLGLLQVRSLISPLCNYDIMKL